MEQSAQDVLNPQIVRIGKRMYRKVYVCPREGTNPEDDEMESDFLPACDDYNDESCMMDFSVEEFGGGFRTRLDFPSTYFKYIIGKKGETKRRIETETRTQMKIPKAGLEGEIVIEGPDRKGVVSAKTRLEVLVDSARQKQPFTHFLSVPIRSEDVVDRFEEFKFQVMEDEFRDPGVDASIFQSSQKLHLTLGTMVLLNAKEVARATDLMHQCYQDIVEPILQGNPLFVDIEGLEYMNDDPGAVDVLYAKIAPGPEADKLQALADRLVDRFVSACVMQHQYDRVKLHITVLNTLFRQDTSGFSRDPHAQRAGRDREAFNATGMLQRFGDFEFGSYQVDVIELSKRYTTAHNGYYDKAGSLKLS